MCFPVQSQMAVLLTVESEAVTVFGCTAVSDYLWSKQILPFGFARHSCSIRKVNTTGWNVIAISGHGSICRCLHRSIILHSRIICKIIFSWNCFNNNNIFCHLSPTSSHLHPLQVENCDSNSRLVVDEDDNGKFRLEGLLLAQRLTRCASIWSTSLVVSSHIIPVP